MKIFFVTMRRQFFDRLATYDERVAELGHRRKDRYVGYWIFIAISIAFAIHATWADVQVSRDSTELAMKTMYMLLQSLTMLLSIFKYDLLVNLIYQRFRHLNESIIPRVSWTRDLAPKNMSYVSPDDVLRLHSVLLEASTIINETYSFIVLFWFANLFVSTVMQIYVAMILSRPMMAYYASNFIMIVATCSICNTTAEEVRTRDSID